MPPRRGTDEEGNLLIRWSEIDELVEEVELAADKSANLKIVRRSHKSP